MKSPKSWRNFADQPQEPGQWIGNLTAALDNLECLGYYSLSNDWYPLDYIDQAASVQRKEVRLVSNSRFENVAPLYVVQLEASVAATGCAGALPSWTSQEVPLRRWYVRGQQC